MATARIMLNTVSTLPCTLTLVDAAATHDLGWQLGQVLPPGTVLLLEGELGSGKTTLVQGLGAGLGITDAIDSPTFTLVNEYLEGRIPLYHLDLYRLSAAEVIDLALETYWDGIEVEPGIVAIEWAERLPTPPDRYLQLQLTYDAIAGRQVRLDAIGSWDLSALLACPPRPQT